MRKIFGGLQKLLTEPRYRNRLIHDFEIKNGRTHFFSKPVCLQIESTNKCNLNCVMCARPYYDKEKNILGDMSIETFEKIVPLIKLAESVILFGYGEPLIAKNFWHFLKRCKELGAKTAIYTNGVKLDKENSLNLIEGGLDNLSLSLDAAREETFKSIRGYSLRKIIENINGLGELKSRLRRQNPAIAISYTLMENNLYELPEMIDLAAVIGASRVSVTHMMIYSNGLDKQSVFHYTEAAKPVFEEAFLRAAKKGIHIELPNLHPIVAECKQPFEMLFVNWNGKVRPCCTAAFVSGEFSFPIGDLSEESLGTIWNNENMLEIRRGLIGKGRMLPQCVGCGFRMKDIRGHKRYLDKAIT